MIDIYSYDMVPLSDFLAEYKELNANNRFRPVAVGRYGIRTRESIYSKELAQDYSKNKLIYKDTLTVGMGSVQMDIGILTDDITYSVSPAYHTYRINGINCDYLRFCLQARNADMFERYKKRGSRQGKSIDLKAWVHYLIPVYEIDGQLQIVSTLHKIQSIIDDRMQELQKLDDLVKARFVEMFGDPIHNENKWSKMPLDLACRVIVDCPHSTPNYLTQDTGYMCIRTSIVKKNKILWNEIEFISESEYLQRIKRKKPEKGDIIYTREGAILGIAAIIDRKCNVALGQRSMLLSPDKRICTSEFLCTAMNFESFLDNALKGVIGSASPHINVGDIKAFQMIMPPVDLQYQFSLFVQQIDKSKFVVQQALDKAQLLFDSLMQQYFG